MYAIGGHINDNMIIADENLSSYEGYDVVITVLDTTNNTIASKTPDKNRIDAAKSLAGLWKGHNDEATVDETVRALRKGRSFDY